ncbi:hypothetical protein MPLB_1680063 [Mesorhizobium sp. ORS 3324]|nr:hypothetical protein MPLB_1680063 [Mesorhizobium sp. ORS 3324]
MLRSIDREGTRSMIFVSAVFAATANKRLKSRANSPEQAQKSSVRSSMIYVRVQWEPRPDTLCDVLDKPDSACRLSDLFSANKIDSASRGIAAC